MLIVPINAFKDYIGPHEDKISHMYLDHKNKVTFGIGFLIPNLSSAFEHPFKFKQDVFYRKNLKPGEYDKDSFAKRPFIPRGDNIGKDSNALIKKGIKAEKEHIEAEIAFIKLFKNLDSGNKKTAEIATFFAQHTVLEVDDGYIEILFESKIHEFLGQIKNTILTKLLIPQSKGFMTYPRSAQLALLDMHYSMGNKRFLGGPGWPHLIEGLRVRDWVEVANESHVKTFQESRNAENKKMFLKAAKEDKAPIPQHKPSMVEMKKIEKEVVQIVKQHVFNPTMMKMKIKQLEKKHGITIKV